MHRKTNLHRTSCAGDGCKPALPGGKVCVVYPTGMDVHQLFVSAGQDLGMSVHMLAGLHTNNKTPPPTDTCQIN
jgi:hypothetical protein